MVIVTVNPDFCKGCGLCREFCPEHAFVRASKPNSAGIVPMVFDESKECKKCLACVLMCPDAAIEIVEVDRSRQQAPLDTATTASS